MESVPQPFMVDKRPSSEAHQVKFHRRLFHRKLSTTGRNPCQVIPKRLGCGEVRVQGLTKTAKGLASGIHSNFAEDVAAPSRTKFVN